jgi:hypothetical protein
MSSSMLRATASEFTPTFAPPSEAALVNSSVLQPAKVPSQQAGQVGQYQQHQATAAAAAAAAAVEQGDDAHWAADAYEGYDDSWGYYDESGNWVECEEDQQAEWEASSLEQQQQQQWQQQEQQQQQQHSQQQQDGYMTMGADDAVALLHSCYPNHPRSLLQQLVGACDGDVQQAARILSDMDFEQRRSRIAAAAAADRAAGSASSRSTTGPVSKKQQWFNYSLEQFPSLGGAPSSSTTSAPPRANSNWAAVASKPVTCSIASSKTQTPASRPVSAAAAKQGTTGSKQWDSKGDSEPVPWVETGAAVSQEYAAARAEASDHARVRNACFQQATIAYIAGDKVRASRTGRGGTALAWKGAIAWKEMHCIP